MTRTSESAAAQSTERHTLSLALRSRVCAALCFGCAWLAISVTQGACASSETLTKGPYDPGAGGAGGSDPGGNAGVAGAGSTTVGGAAGDSGAGGGAGDPNGGASGAAQGGANQGGANQGGAGGASQGGSAQGGANQAGSGGSNGGAAGSGNAGSGSGGSTANGGSAGTGSGGCASVNATSAANSCNGQALPSGYSCWNVSGVNGATGNDSNPACGGGGLAGQDLVFSFVAPQSGQVYLSMTGPFEKAIYVMLGSCTNQPIQCVRRTDFAAASTSFTATSGDTFYVFVDSTSDGEWGAFDLSITY